MKMILRLAFVVVMINGVASANQPPNDVAERFLAAQNSLESDQFVGSYTVAVTSDIAKADGSARVATEMEMSIKVAAGGSKIRHLERFIVDGEDRTEKNRKKLESGDDENDGEEDEDFLMPFGDSADRFVFGPIVAADGHLEMTFGPAPGHEKDRAVTRGTMAWNVISNDPLWLEFEVLRPQKPMRELNVRMEFIRAGDETFMNRMVTDGKVKVLLLKRNFHMEMLVSDLVPQ